MMTLHIVCLRKLYLLCNCTHLLTQSVQNMYLYVLNDTQYCVVQSDLYIKSIKILFKIAFDSEIHIMFLAN